MKFDDGGKGSISQITAGTQAIIKASECADSNVRRPSSKCLEDLHNQGLASQDHTSSLACEPRCAPPRNLCMRDSIILFLYLWRSLLGPRQLEWSNDLLTSVKLDSLSQPTIHVQKRDSSYSSPLQTTDICGIQLSPGMEEKVISQDSPMPMKQHQTRKSDRHSCRTVFSEQIPPPGPSYPECKRRQERLPKGLRVL